MNAQQARELTETGRIVNTLVMDDIIKIIKTEASNGFDKAIIHPALSKEYADKVRELGYIVTTSTEYPDGRQIEYTKILW